MANKKLGTIASAKAEQDEAVEPTPLPTVANVEEADTIKPALDPREQAILTIYKWRFRLGGPVSAATLRHAMELAWGVAMDKEAIREVEEDHCKNQDGLDDALRTIAFTRWFMNVGVEQAENFQASPFNLFPDAKSLAEDDTARMLPPGTKPVFTHLGIEVTKSHPLWKSLIFTIHMRSDNLKLKQDSEGNLEMWDFDEHREEMEKALKDMVKGGMTFAMTNDGKFPLKTASTYGEVVDNVQARIKRYKESQKRKRLS
jgi:hypothetical protein